MNTSRLRLTIDVKSHQGLMVVYAVSVWEPIPFAQVSDGTLFHALLDEFESILTAAQFWTPIALDNLSVRSLR